MGLLLMGTKLKSREGVALERPDNSAEEIA